MHATVAVAETIRDEAIPLTRSARDYDPLLKMVGDAHFVLLGEATHGTHEYYCERAQITKRLIREKGFNVVAVEADWPDAYRVNRYIQLRSNDSDAEEALNDFKRFPTWMWRNADVLDFVGWLREHNESVPETNRAGFYGLDLYSLHASIEAVLVYLNKMDPQEARRARARYSCFDHFGQDGQRYAYAAARTPENSCEEEVITQLVELRRRAADYAKRDGFVAEDEFFFAEQNARVVRNVEEYYRAMFHERDVTWNLRDRHMAETLESLMTHLRQQGKQGKAVVWEHNSHLGDARATQMSERGELNLGQLVREKHRQDALLVGFTTYSGSVTAASEWDAPAEHKRVRPALPESYEALFHEAGLERFMLDLRDNLRLQEIWREPRLERAIGVIYLPQTERYSHYFDASLADQFDAVLHFDWTRAVEPLERSVLWQRGEMPDTYPTSL